MERLRQIEKNYEKDMADIAKEKQPALARSETHEIEHAWGTIRRDPQEKKRASKETHKDIASWLMEKD